MNKFWSGNFQKTYLRKKSIFFIFFAIFLFFILLSFKAEASPDSSWLSGWSYRKSHAIANGGSSYPVEMKVFYKNFIKEEILGTGYRGIPQDYQNNLLAQVGTKLMGGVSDDAYTKEYVIVYDYISDTTDVYEIGDTPIANYHYRPFIWKDKNNYLWAFDGYWSTGWADTYVRWARSTNPNDPSSWSSLTNTTLFKSSYPFAYQNPTSGRIYILARSYDEDYWSYIYTDDNGSSWSNPTTTIFPSSTSELYYIQPFFDSNTQRLHVASVGNRSGASPVEVRDNIYYAYSDDYGVTWKNFSDTTITDIADAKIWTGNVSRCAITLDASNKPMIGAVLENQDSGYEELFFLYHDGESWIKRSIKENYDFYFVSIEIIFINGKVYVFGTRKIDSTYYKIRYSSVSPYTSWEETSFGESYGFSYVLVDNMALALYSVNHAGESSNYYFIAFEKDTNIGIGKFVALNEKCQTDFDDVRVTESDGLTVIAGESNGWMKEKVDSDYAIIYVEIPEDQTIYVYYGNSIVTWSEAGEIGFLETLWTDDMEGTVGEVPTNYTDISSSSCEFRISNTQAHGGTKSTRCQDNNNNGWSHGLRNDAVNSFYHLHIYGYFPQTTQPAAIYVFQTGQTDLVALMYFQADGKVYAYDGTTETEIMPSYVVDHWYHIEIRFDYASKQYDVYIDDVLKAENFGFYTGTATQSKSLRFTSGKSYASTDYWYWDDVSDEGIDPEDAHGSWGNEETLRSDGESCTSASECRGGYCVHNICRSDSIYCGDSYCDSGESCHSCRFDCGICPGGGYASENQFCYSNASCYPGLYCVDNECKKTVAPVEEEVPEEVLECPICSEPTEWSNCIDNKQTRTNYRCSAETNYVCQSYIEERDCISKEEIKPIWTDIFYEYWYVLVIIVIVVVLFYRLKILK